MALSLLNKDLVVQPAIRAGLSAILVAGAQSNLGLRTVGMWVSIFSFQPAPPDINLSHFFGSRSEARLVPKILNWRTAQMAQLLQLMLVMFRTPRLGTEH